MLAIERVVEMVIEAYLITASVLAKVVSSKKDVGLVAVLVLMVFLGSCMLSCATVNSLEHAYNDY